MFDKNVPVPAGRARQKCYNWKSMEVGDSLFVPYEEGATYNLQKRLSHYANCALGSGNYKTRVDVGGVRVWRTA